MKVSKHSIDSNSGVVRTERGWPGHYICSHLCLFRRNTLLACGETKVVVSTVGLQLANPREDDPKKRFETIGLNRYFETMAFHAGNDEYQDAEVSRQVNFKSKWAIAELDGDLKANEMHEAVVAELEGKLLKGDKLDG
jgi:hypothetical protein